MGCFKEIYTEQMNDRVADSNHSSILAIAEFYRLKKEPLRIKVDPKDLETLLADEKDEFTLSLFRHPEDTLSQNLALNLLS